MGPPIESWPARQLPVRVLARADGKRRKDAHEIDLDKCPLQELVQYACDPEKNASGKVVVRCKPLVRTFRQCKDFWVETTPLENPEAK